MADEQRPVRPRVIRTPRRREPRRLVASPHRSGRTLAILAALVIASIFISYDVAGIADLQQDPVTGVDYIPVVNFVEARKQPGEKVLVALPPPAYLAFRSTNDLIFLSSPISRKRAQRYTRLTEDGGYVDYWTGVDSVVDTASLCQTLYNEPGLWLIVDEARLNADWAFQGSMATVIRGLTYVRYEAEGARWCAGCRRFLRGIRRPSNSAPKPRPARFPTRTRSWTSRNPSRRLLQRRR